MGRRIAYALLTITVVIAGIVACTLIVKGGS